MVLRLLAVVGEGHVAIVVVGEGDGRGRGQGNTLVGGAQEHVEVDAGIDDPLRVAAAQGRQRRTGGEGAGIEEIGAAAARLEGEFTEAQYVVAPRELDESALVILHGRGSFLDATQYSGMARFCMIPP